MGILNKMLHSSEINENIKQTFLKPLERQMNLQMSIVNDILDYSQISIGTALIK